MMDKQLELGHYVLDEIRNCEGVVTAITDAQFLGGVCRRSWSIGWRNAGELSQSQYVDCGGLVVLDRPKLVPQRSVEPERLEPPALGQVVRNVVNGYVGAVDGITVTRYLSGRTVTEINVKALAIEPMMPINASYNDYGQLVPHGDRVIDVLDPESHTVADTRVWNDRQ